MISINLNDLTGLPNNFLKELASFNQFFEETDSLEQLDDNCELQVLIEEIDQFCSKNEVFGFHYTRAYPQDILKNGLLSRPGQDIRSEFLKRNRSLFSEMEVKQILNAWNKCFDESDEQHRDYHVFFNFTLTALTGLGSELLLENSGGEQVYGPIYTIEGIKDKLRNIGTPLIVKCSLNPKNLNTFIQYPWGKIAASTYHRTRNPNALQTDQDGYQLTSVPPEKIELIKLEE